MANNDIFVPKAVRSAESGSLLYDCVEKMAYQLHLKDHSRDQDSNWFLAQDYLDYWLQTRWGSFIAPSVSNLVQMCLDNATRSYHEQGKPVDDMRYEFTGVVIGACEHNGFAGFRRAAA